MTLFVRHLLSTSIAHTPAKLHVPWLSRRQENACPGHTSKCSRCNACPCAILQKHDGLQIGSDVSMEIALPRDAGRKCRPGTEGTFWRRRGLIRSSPWGSYRVRQGRGIIIIACIGAPCPCRPVIIGLSWRPITIGVLPVQRWCCKHSNTFQPILSLPTSCVGTSLTAAFQSGAAYLSGL